MAVPANIDKVKLVLYASATPMQEETVAKRRAVERPAALFAAQV